MAETKVNVVIKACYLFPKTAVVNLAAYDTNLVAYNSTCLSHRYIGWKSGWAQLGSLNLVTKGTSQ